MWGFVGTEFEFCLEGLPQGYSTQTSVAATWENFFLHSILIVLLGTR